MKLSQIILGCLKCWGETKTFKDDLFPDLEAQGFREVSQKVLNVRFFAAFSDFLWLALRHRQKNFVKRCGVVGLGQTEEMLSRNIRGSLASRWVTADICIKLICQLVWDLQRQTKGKCYDPCMFVFYLWCHPSVFGIVTSVAKCSQLQPSNLSCLLAKAWHNFRAQVRSGLGAQLLFLMVRLQH